MKMKSGAEQKGKAIPATQGRTRNQPEAGHFVQKSGTSGPWANSRSPVHPNFDRHSSVGAKKERRD